MREEYDRTGDTSLAVISGISRTGRLVTSAALILFFAFSALATSPGIDGKILGTAMGVGILIDATTVRAPPVPPPPPRAREPGDSERETVPASAQCHPKSTPARRHRRSSGVGPGAGGCRGPGHLLGRLTRSAARTWTAPPARMRAR